MLKEIINGAPFYITLLALGLNGIYLFRDWALKRQKQKDAELAKSEKENEAERA